MGSFAFVLPEAVCLDLVRIFNGNQCRFLVMIGSLRGK